MSNDDMKLAIGYEFREEIWSGRLSFGDNSLWMIVNESEWDFQKCEFL